jgi:Tol biopolymer transport system component
MIDERGLDRLLTDWLADGPDRGPSDVLAAGLARTRRTRQERAWLIRWRGARRRRPVRVTLAAASLLLVAGVLLALAFVLLTAGSRTGAAGRVLYVGTDGIYLMNPDGTGRTDLSGGKTLFGGYPDLAVSPDGQRLLAFDYSFETLDKLYVVDLATKAITEILADRRLATTAPAWMPDGRSFLVTLQPSTGPPQLARVEADGTGLRPVAPDLAGSIAGAPSPDGGEVAFYGTPDGTDWGLYVGGTDGSGIRRIASVTFGTAPHKYVDRDFPSWSPDGSRIAYITAASSKAPEELSVVGASGGDARPVTNAPANVDSAVWSPDGRWLAYTSWPNGRDMEPARPADLYVADGATLTPHLLVSGAEADQIAWSPSGDRLAFFGGRWDPGNQTFGDIFEVAPDGTGLVKVGERRNAGGIAWPGAVGN